MKHFNLVLIKPTHYDDDGYVIQWLRSAMPANSLAALYALAQDCDQRKVLGDDVEMHLWAADETNTRIRPENLARKMQDQGGKGLVALVGVQSNQYPRALDLAKRFRELGVQVCIGGFHVSGCLAMLPEITPELQEALNLGVSLFAGEAEGRLETVLQTPGTASCSPSTTTWRTCPPWRTCPRPFYPGSRSSTRPATRPASTPGEAVPSYAASAPSSTCRGANPGIAAPTTWSASSRAT